MGIITVVVHDERGTQITKQISLPTEVLPSVVDERFGFLRFVDPYGDTVFNRLQMPQVLQELKLLETIVHESDQLKLIKEIEGLAFVCQKGPHLYLKFIGD
jgi:hypothetical protein